MPLVVSAEVYRLVQTTRFAATITCMNEFHFGREAAGGSANALAIDWRDFAVPLWKPMVFNTITFVEVSVQMIAPTEGDIVRVVLSGPGTATGSTPAPCNSAGCITWRSQLAGRSRRGRSFIAGLEYGAGSSNYMTWNATRIGTMSTFATGLTTRYSLGGNPGAFFMVVWSRKLGGATPPRNPAAGAAMISGFTPQPYICTMGTRRSGRGM